MILTPDQRLRVFISSTLDMSDERAAARRSVERLDLTPVMFEAGARHALAAKALFAIWSAEYNFAVAALLDAAQTAREAGDRRTLAYADVAVGLVRALTASMKEGTETVRRGIATSRGSATRLVPRLD